FQDKPYGWKQLDIAGLIAELLKEQRIRIRYNSEYLEPESDVNQLLTVFGKTTEADKGIILKRVKVDERLIRNARQICRDIFNKTDLADDEDGLVKDIRDLIDKKIAEVNSYRARYEGRKYPGMSLLDKGLEYFEQFDNKLDNASFFKKLTELEDDLADWEEDIVYVESFFGTNQKEIFDQGLKALSMYEENKTYLVGKEIAKEMEKLQSIIQDPIPYQKIKDIPELVHVLDKEIKLILNEKKVNALEKLKLDYDELSILAKQYGVSNETKQQVDDYYDRIKGSLETFKDIFKVDATISQSASYKERTASEIRLEIAKWQRKKEEEARKNAGGKVVETPVTEPVVQKQSVKLKELVNVTTLSTEEDVDRYINTLSHKLKQIIKANKQIEFIE
ncbi:MAG: BREX system P-loop protein BrxC, partial [Erysipelothrix sp.]|nr:BREX system P-loop protein BrxC [Erysipelothrix sp.]